MFLNGSLINACLHSGVSEGRTDKPAFVGGILFGVMGLPSGLIKCCERGVQCSLAIPQRCNSFCQALLLDGQVKAQIKGCVAGTESRGRRRATH